MVRVEGEAIIRVNGTEAGKQLQRLEERASGLRKEIIELNKAEVIDKKKLRSLEKQLKDVNQEAKYIQRNVVDFDKALKNLSGASIRDLNKLANKLNFEMQMLGRNTTAYAQKAKQLNSVRAELNKVRNEVKGTSGGFKEWLGSTADGFTRFFALGASITAMLTGVVMSIKSLVVGTAELSDKIADVQKTTGMTKDEVADLMETFKTFNTRTPRAELLSLARIAGKLGIEGVKNVGDFVREADKINVALGEDLGNDPEEVIRQLGKLTETFKLNNLYGQAEALNKVGSAINALGANSTANEGFIVEFSKRVAGVAPMADMSVDQILGLASTLDQLGQTAEVSATVFNQIIPNMFKDTEMYAKAAGMSTEDFAELLEKDANKALLKFLEGMKGNNEGLGEMAQKLDGLGIDGTRAIAVIGALANNTELLRSEQKLANKEFEAGTSLVNEFNVKNNTLAGDMERLGKALHSMFVNSSVLKGMEKFIGYLADMTEIPAADAMRDENEQLNNLARTLMLTNPQSSARRDIMEEINQKYPDFLKGLDWESDVNKQLSERLAIVNNEYIKKARIMGAQKRIQEQANQIAETEFAMQALYKELELQYTSLLKKGAVTYISPENRSVATMEAEMRRMREEYGNKFAPAGQWNGAFGTISDIKEQEAALKELNLVYISLLEDLERVKTLAASTGDPAWDAYIAATGGVVPKRSGETKKKAFAGMAPKPSGADKWVKPDFDFNSPEDPDIPFDYDYNPYADQYIVRDNYGNIKRTKGGKIIYAKHGEHNTEFQEQLESEADFLNQKKLGQIAYDEWKRAKDQQLHQEEMARIQEKADAYAQMFGTIASLTDMYAEGQRRKYGEDSKEYKRALRGKVLAQLAMDTASAISSLVAVSEANPLNAVTFGSAGMLQWANGILRIGANFAKAKMSLQEINEGYAVGGQTNVSGGGRVGSKQVAWFGERGPEYVIPNEGYQNPSIARVIDALEFARTTGTMRTADFGALLRAKGFAVGGQTMPAMQQPQMYTDPMLVQMLQTLIAETRANRPVATSWYDTQKALRKLEDIQNRTKP